MSPSRARQRTVGEAASIVEERQPRTDLYPLLSAPLELLPAELKLRIASHLTALDATSLALVSRSLQDAAESILYRAIDISLPIAWRPSPAVLEATRGYRLHQYGDPKAPAMTHVIAGCRTDRLRFMSNGALAALLARPQRGSWATGLVIELGHKDEMSAELIKIVELVRERLLELTILPAAFDNKVCENVSEYLQMLRRDKPLRRLEQLTFAPPGHISLHTSFEQATALAPNMTHLTMTALPLSWLIWNKEANTDDEGIAVPNLVSLVVQNVTPGHMNVVGRWAELCSNLQTLSVYCEDEAESWLGRPNQTGFEHCLDAINRLRNHENLKRLEWIGGWGARHGLEKLCEEGFDALEVLVQSEAIQCESETYIENIHIPPFSNLRAIVIPCRNSKWYRHLSLPEWGKAPPPHSSIGSHTITALRAARSLLAVQFGATISTSTSFEEIMDSGRWCRSRSNGVLIRSYYNPGTGEEMFHLRRLELLAVTPKVYDTQAYIDAYGSPDSQRKRDSRRTGSVKPDVARAHAGSGSGSGSGSGKLDSCTGADHRWTDHTSYDGYPIPPDILKKTYRAAASGNGSEKDKDRDKDAGGWSTPGRELELAEGAWDVLRKWRSKLPRREEGGRRVVTRGMTALAGAAAVA